MDVISIKQEKELLEQAMNLLIKVQLGNGNKRVECMLDGITDDLSAVIEREF